MNLELTAEELVFASRVRAFIQASLPHDMARAWHLSPTVFPEPVLVRQWHAALHRQGWVAPHWPEAYGGPGWSLTQRYIWQVLCARAGAPQVAMMSLWLIAPVLMHYGTPEQREYFLPRILSGEHYWCQGYSEPGAGSDLASLRTRATADGTDYIIDGTKLWTTHAHCADWMFALVRTADTGKRQEGITFLLIDMRSPGVSVRPILTIGGDHEVNQVFFDGARVPQANRIGAEGQGWEIAKYVLEFERGGEITSAALRAQLASAVALAKRLDDGGRKVADDPDILRGIAEVGTDLDAHEMLELRLMSELQSGGSPGATASMLKLRASQLQQAISELVLRIAGDAALRWHSGRPLYEIDPSQRDPDDAIVAAAPRYLNNRANTIFGGSAEIQKSLIARYAVGL
jgi:acyl-CoA dehydrogenase